MYCIITTSLTKILVLYMLVVFIDSVVAANLITFLRMKDERGEFVKNHIPISDDSLLGIIDCYM